MIEYTARITSQEPVTEELRGEISAALDAAGSSLNLATGLAQDLATANSKIDSNSQYTINLINEAQSQICDLQVLGMSDGGVVEVKRQAACVRYDVPIGKVQSQKNIPKPQYVRERIRLTLYSDYAQLKSQVATLTRELNKLKEETRITPISNSDLRRRGSTLYPQYGDWLLTSDASDQYISFSGLSAEIGRSIYIQTRKRAYLYANRHSFFGLSAAGSGLSSNQWLESKTTYRFVRKDATTWLVTSSSSPYPWV